MSSWLHLQVARAMLGDAEGYHAAVAARAAAGAGGEAAVRVYEMKEVQRYGKASS